LLIVALAHVLHVLDYPFLRDKPEYALIGFTVGVMVVLAVAVLGPVCAAEVLEQRTREELSRRATLLERQNEQLEDFAHAASHDLREPLRHLVLYSDLLEQSFPERRGDEQHAHVEQIRSAALGLETRVGSMLTQMRSS